MIVGHARRADARSDGRAFKVYSRTRSCWDHLELRAFACARYRGCIYEPLIGGRLVREGEHVSGASRTDVTRRTCAAGLEERVHLRKRRAGAAAPATARICPTSSGVSAARSALATALSAMIARIIIRSARSSRMTRTRSRVLACNCAVTRDTHSRCPGHCTTTGPWSDGRRARFASRTRSRCACFSCRRYCRRPRGLG